VVAVLAVVVALSGRVVSTDDTSPVAPASAIERSSPSDEVPAVVTDRTGVGRVALTSPLVAYLAAMLTATIGLLVLVVSDRRSRARPAFAATSRRVRAPPR
jgi:hypothetical protein